MAHLKDLIVSGVTRFIGKVYGTITNAIKDDKDQTISSTYIKDISGSGTNSLTITKGDGSSSTVAMNVTSDNAINADTVDGKHASDFISMPISVAAGTSAISSLSDGTYTGTWTDHPAVNEDGQGTLIVSNYGTNGAPSPWNHRTFISPHSGKIWHGMANNSNWYGWQLINDGGNADTVDGIHISVTPDGNTTNWFGVFTTYNELHAISPTDAYVGNAGNANTLGGIVDAYHLGTIGSANNTHGTEYQLYCKHNIYGDNRFGLEIANRIHEVRVDYATNAHALDGYDASYFAASSHKQAYTTTECTTYTSDVDTMGITPAAVKKAFDIFKPYTSGIFTYSNSDGVSMNSLGFMPSAVFVTYLNTTLGVTRDGSGDQPLSYITINSNGFTVRAGLSNITITQSTGATPILNGGTKCGYIAFK